MHTYVKLIDLHSLHVCILLHVNKKNTAVKIYLIWNVLKSWHKGNVINVYLFYFILIEMYLIYNVMIVSGV